MSRTTVTRTINASVERVFETVSDINNFSKAVPDIVKVEFLSDVKSGVGAKFRETRRMKGKEASAELEVTEYVENDHIRLVAKSHGTVWDSVFSVKPVGGGTELTLVMDANARNVFAKMMNKMIQGMVQKGVEKDMDAVKEYCEGA